jgi:hypothetical protein
MDRFMLLPIGNPLINTKLSIPNINKPYNLMGNIPIQNQNNKVRPKKLTKMQVEIACLKVRAHLELVKDRKVN